jgi:hypothetical protein
LDFRTTGKGFVFVEEVVVGFSFKMLEGKG